MVNALYIVKTYGVAIILFLFKYVYVEPIGMVPSNNRLKLMAHRAKIPSARSSTGALDGLVTLETSY